MHISTTYTIVIFRSINTLWRTFSLLDYPTIYSNNQYNILPFFFMQTLSTTPTHKMSSNRFTVWSMSEGSVSIRYDIQGKYLIFNNMFPINFMRHFFTFWELFQFCCCIEDYFLSTSLSTREFQIAQGCHWRRLYSQVRSHLIFHLFVVG